MNITKVYFTYTKIMRIFSESLQTLLIATLIPSVLVLALGVSFATWYKCHGSKLR